MHNAGIYIQHAAMKTISHIPLLFLLLFLCADTYAQVIPANGDSLNYRYVGFVVPEKMPGTTYQLEVGYFNPTDKTMSDKPLLVKSNTANKVLELLPAFGKSYAWRVMYYQKKSLLDSTPYYHFTVMHNPYTDTSMSVMRIIDAAKGHDDLFVMVDRMRTMYNMQGEAIWFLPNLLPDMVDNLTIMRDMEMTPFNTITFLSSRKHACEVDFKGKLLWKAPNNGKVSGDKHEYLHHEFTRLKNGNYMVAGHKYMEHKVPDNPAIKLDSTAYKKNGADYVKLEAGTLIEYNAKGDVVWTWNSSEHFTDTDLFTPLPGGALFTETHMNAFHFDETKKVIYMSFRNMSRVIKISYPDGKILARYGEDYTKDNTIQGNGLFYGQHACRLNSKGELMLFNNNNPWRGVPTDSSRVASAILLKEMRDGGIKKVWDFSCDIDSFARGFTNVGGSICELRNGDYLVSMGITNRNFIVSRKKKIAWNTRIDYLKKEQGWAPDGYRISPVYRDQLEAILFNIKP